MGTLEPGGSVEGSIDAGDRASESAEIVRRFGDRPVLGERYAVRVDEAGVHSLELHSFHFDAYLLLRDAGGVLLAEDDNSGPSLDARITTDVLKPGQSYTVEVAAVDGDRGAPGERGALLRCQAVRARSSLGRLRSKCAARRFALGPGKEELIHGVASGRGGGPRARRA